jgi:hypothetical protein
MRRLLALALCVLPVVSCGGDSATAEPDFVGDVRRAAAAVEDELGGPQEFFEITASAPLTNVFVAVDDARAAIPYVYRDGMLEPPGPRLDGASGHTFTSEAIAFDDDRVLTNVADELPDAMIDSLSVEGGPEGSVRYVVSARSLQGGVLDVVVGEGGAILSVEPV